MIKLSKIIILSGFLFLVTSNHLYAQEIIDLKYVKDDTPSRVTYDSNGNPNGTSPSVTVTMEPTEIASTSVTTFQRMNPANAAQIYTLSQNIRFDPNFDFTAGGKVGYGLGGGESPFTSGGNADPRGFTSRLVWGKGGHIRLYAYHAERLIGREQDIAQGKKIYGEVWKSGDPAHSQGPAYYAPRGKWINFTMEVKVNSNASARDGYVKVWADGQNIINSQGVQWISQGNNFTVNSFPFGTFHGGKGPEYVPTRTTSISFSDAFLIPGSAVTLDPKLQDAVDQIIEKTGVTPEQLGTVAAGIVASGIEPAELAAAASVLQQVNVELTPEILNEIAEQTGISVNALQTSLDIAEVTNLPLDTISAVTTEIVNTGLTTEDLTTIADALALPVDIEEPTGSYTQDELDTIELVEGLTTVEDTTVSRGASTTDIQLMEKWVPPFMLMTQQFTAMMIQQVEIIGTFFDAKHQLETQRLFQQKIAKAHKDYHPSAELCEVGTLTRDLVDAQQRTKITRNVIAQAAIQRQLAAGTVKTSDLGDDDPGVGGDIRTRRTAFVRKFCNIYDNAGFYELVCGSNGDKRQQNADINYTQTIDSPLTLNMNFYPDESGIAQSPTLEEENIFAFLDQIFMNDAFPTIKQPATMLHNFVKPYLEMRSLIAMRSVAQNSFAHIIAEKTVGPSSPEKVITPYIFSLLEEMGLPNIENIVAYIGENPSYYAQMEVLTKKIFQHPQFISNLYDKPVNVQRMKASLNAIKLMQDRDIHQAMMRREMLTSMILELQLRHREDQLEINIEKLLSREPDKPDFIYGGGEANNFGVGTYNDQTGGGGF